MTWILRFIHALVDHDDARLAFAHSYDVMDRQDLDGRHRPTTEVRCVYEIISRYYNSPEYNPLSTDLLIL